MNKTRQIAGKYIANKIAEDLKRRKEEKKKAEKKKND